jgi:RND family efflux transporter MFP subunit
MTQGLTSSRLAAIGVLAALAACQEQASPEKPPMPVKVQVVRAASYTPSVALTGEVKAQVESDLSFRVSGRIAERNVEVGAHVTAEQQLARLDPKEQQAGLDAAEATVQAAEAQLRQAASTFERQKALLARGYTTRRENDQAEEAFRMAQGSLESANAQRATARDQLSYTVLRAGAPGIITARNAEAGQVVQAAQSVFTIAQDGGRDAVFNVFESAFANELADGTVSVALVNDPGVTAVGKAREVSPTVDAASGTVRVKIGLNGSAASMPLGAAVTGTARFKSRPVVTLPWSALAAQAGQPAMWVVDPATKAVSLRAVAIDGYGAGTIFVRDGLPEGTMVVTAGAQLLNPGQVVNPLEETPR